MSASKTPRPIVDPLAGHSDAASLIVRLLAFLRARRFEPGERLPSERLMCERFGVTRRVVREAMVLLEALRLIVRRPRSGAYLTAESRVGSLDAVVMRANLGLPPDDGETESLNEFRAILEGQSVVLACQRRTPADIQRMDDCIAQCRAMHAARTSIARPSAEFHLAIMEATHNQFLVRAANSFYMATKAAREIIFAAEGVGEQSIQEHQRIRDAIAQGEVESARRAMEEHLHSARANAAAEGSRPAPE